MKLYEFKQEFKSLQYLVESDLEFDEETGEIKDNSEMIASLFHNLKSDFSEKLDATSYIIKEIIADAELLKKESDRLLERSKRLSKNAEYLKQLMQDAIIESGETKVKTLTHNYTIRTSKAVDIYSNISPEDIDRKFTRLMRAFDKTAIKKAIEAGEELTFATIKENKSLTIK